MTSKKTDLNITKRNRASGNERKTTNGTAEREGETREEGQACRGRRQAGRQVRGAGREEDCWCYQVLRYARHNTAMELCQLSRIVPCPSMAGARVARLSPLTHTHTPTPMTTSPYTPPHSYEYILHIGAQNTHFHTLTPTSTYTNTRRY